MDDNNAYLQENIADTVSMVTNYTTLRTNGRLAYSPTYAMVGDNPNAGTDPEVIAPLSKLQAMLPTGDSEQNLRITLGRQLTAKGRDFVYVLGKENFKSEVLGGLSLN